MIDFEIYTVGTGYFLEKAFNGIRFVLEGGGFMTLLKLAVAISLIVKITRSVFEFEIKSLALWFVQVTLVTSVLIVPAARVRINRHIT